MPAEDVYAELLMADASPPHGQALSQTSKFEALDSHAYGEALLQQADADRLRRQDGDNFTDKPGIGRKQNLG